MAVTPMSIFWNANKHRSVVQYNAFRERVVLRGMTFEEALTAPRKRFDGTDDEYKKWSEIAVENDITKNMFWHRHKRLGWSLEKAATTPKREKKSSDDGINAIKRMIEAGVPIPRKYKKKYPELFNGQVGA